MNKKAKRIISATLVTIFTFGLTLQAYASTWGVDGYVTFL